MGSESQATSPSSASMPSTLPLAVPRTPKARRNVLDVVLGDTIFSTWYPSFYPEEIIGREVQRLYVCQWCFKYSKELMPFAAHVAVCHAKDEDPPGHLIYSKNSHSIYEVDGEVHKLFTQNLSLFAKLFLDNKSVFFDVSSFNYYLLVHRPTGQTLLRPQIVGFFSKEKMSWDNNNLACILVFPPWQRQGLGKILMGVSYELSRREGRIGGPEKPLSELGRCGYQKFWEARVANAIIGMRNKASMTVEEVSRHCWMAVDDVIIALKEMDLLEPRKKGAALLISKKRVREWAVMNKVDLVPPVDTECFFEEWMPIIADETDS